MDAIANATSSANSNSDTVEQRLYECLRGYVLEAAKARQAVLAKHTTADTEQLQNPEVTIFVASSSADDSEVRHSRRWAACAGLIAQKEDSAPQQDGPRLQLFHNYADVPCIPEGFCKALRRVSWTSFGLALEDIALKLDGSASLTFASTADPISKDFRLLVIHVVPPQHDNEAHEAPRLPKLSAQWEAKIVKDAVYNVLVKVKQSQQCIMLSPFEQRMSCLSHIARSIAGMVAYTDNEAFRQKALQLAQCNLADLQDTIQARLEGMALDVMAAAEASAKNARKAERQKSLDEGANADSLDPEE